jgi:hypothetical protein
MIREALTSTACKTPLPGFLVGNLLPVYKLVRYHKLGTRLIAREKYGYNIDRPLCPFSDCTEKRPCVYQNSTAISKRTSCMTS